VLPRKDIWSNGVFAATYTLNGDGEMTGTHWIRDLAGCGKSSLREASPFYFRVLNQGFHPPEPL
jgi:hypothetical protein